jgi:maltose O-acetyltransferase
MNIRDRVNIYEKNSRPRSFSKTEWLLLKLRKIPIIGKSSLIKKIVCNIYGIPTTTFLRKDFYCSRPNFLTVGENVNLSDTFIIASAPVIIGNNTGFSFRNMIITSSHDYTKFSTVIGKPVIIGNNVWITSNVTILSGVTIGDNTIIGAGSVVTKNIPSGVFAAGNPCKVIKKIDFNMNWV